MVQFFERGPSRSALQSQILGEGIGKGAGEVAGKLINRHETQNAIENVRKMAKDPNANPIDIMLDMYKEMSKTKQGAKIMPELSRMILNQRNVQNEYGNKDLIPGNEPQAAPIKNPVTGEMIPAAEPSQVSQNEMPSPVQYPTSGVLPSIIPEDQIEAMSKQAAGSSGDLQRYQAKRQELESRNANAERELNLTRKRAENYVSGPDEIPEFIDLGRQYAYMTDRDQWERATAQKWAEYKSKKEALNNAFAPGFWTGLLQGGKGRESAIARLQPSFKDMQKNGMEQYARKIAASKGLSPTEVEELAHPLTDKQKMTLHNFPKQKGIETEIDMKTMQPKKAANIDKEKIWNDLTKFFGKNLDEKTSLSLLRHKLWQEKNVPWELIGPAIRKTAESKGYVFTPDQQRELTEIETVAPRQDLSNIFQEWWSPIEYIKRSK